MRASSARKGHLMSQRSSNNKRSGFSLVELLIAMTVLIVILGIVGFAVTGSLRVKGREMQMIEMQQNLRSALQLISQDARAGAFIHVWNDSSCTNGICSRDDRIALVTTDGVMTMIPEPPGASYNNSAITGVCDARDFEVGDLAIVVAGDDSVDLVEVTGINQQANYSQPCKGPHGKGSPNRDQVQHNKQKLTGKYSTTNHMFRAVIATYSLQPDPVDSESTVLHRMTGLSSVGPQSGIVAFHVSDLALAYGVPVDPDVAASQLVFYPSLSAAASALGAGYTAFPSGSGQTYVGSVVQAVRISLTGRTPNPINSAGEHGEFTLTETVEFRR